MRREKSIAVLPFANLSPSVEDELFCDGITEEIINSLSKIDDVFVTSRTSSFHFKHQEIGLISIAERLSVKYIVEGSVRRSGENVRVTVQLINAKDDYHYWSENYDRKFENIFQIQDEIALEVREKFRELIGHFEIESTNNSKFRSNSIEAYECVLRARRVATDLSEQNVSIGLEFIEKAISLEPENPTYYATKATFIMALGIMGSIHIDKAVSMAESACNKALEMDPDDAEANALKGYMYFSQFGDITKFNKYLNKALKEHPKLTFALYFKSIVASALGNYEESMEALDLAEEVNPMSQLPPYFRCVNLMRLRRYDEAMEEADKFLKDNPDHINVYNIKGLIYLRTGKLKIALAHFCKMPSQDGRIPYYGGMAMAFALLGNISEAEHHLHLAEKEDQRLHLQYKENPKVLVNFLLSKFTEGFKALEADIKTKEWYLRFYRTIPFFDTILKDPRAKVLDQLIIEASDSNENEEAAKYLKSGLSEEEVQRLSKRLGKLMKKEKPYLDPDINLKKLALKLDVSANNLSQIINSKKNKNFFDYINSYRIREMIEKLNTLENKQYTLLSLAMDSGFNSKSTFNASFKKMTGLTPSEYLKSIQVQNSTVKI